ncbi:MAG: hypothetical protein E4G71_05980 [Candidatus Atribacteria bacterium]|nr:MAG: hypothetical protein E4G71_05980 [Candidatus Atribacteria bacterium]
MLTHYYDHGAVYTSRSWGIKTVIKGMYYPFIGISCIGNLQHEPELIWQGQGIKSTQKSNLKKYECQMLIGYPFYIGGDFINKKKLFFSIF